MSEKRSSDGASGVVGGIIIGIIALITMVPKPVWIAVGVIVAVSVVAWIGYRITAAAEKRAAAARERERVRREAEATAAKREREEKLQKERQRRIDTLGKDNAKLVESALSAVKEVGASEAARAGWLGDVDFTADVRGITDNFLQVYALRGVIKELAALGKPGPDDR